MRKMTMALALLAVLAMAKSSYAGLTISVDLSPVQPSGAGYASWLVRLGGARSFSDINIMNMDWTGPGVVVQSNPFREDWDFDPPPMDPIPTVWGTSAGGPHMPPTHKAMDTHLLIASPGIQLGRTGVETNTAYGPDGFGDPPVSLIPPVSGYYCNMGTFTSEPLAAFALAAPLPAGTPFMQVVLPNHKSVWLDCNTDAGAIHHQVPPDPEPSTTVTLIIGAACLLGFRWRRRRTA